MLKVTKKNCFLFLASSLFLAGSCQAALVPCGGPNQHPCTICDLFTLTQTVMKYLVFVLVPALIAFWIVAAGLYYMGSQGDARKLATAGKLIKATGFGSVILFTGWVFVNTFFAATGIAEWNGFKLNESWWQISAKCAKPDRDAVESCGDKILQADEECEPEMTIAACQARYGWSKEKCAEAKSKCSLDCKLAESIGDDDDIIITDDGDANDESGFVDYCAVPANEDYLDNIANRDLRVTAKEAARATRIMPLKGMNCENACKKINKTCIGIGSFDELNCGFLYQAIPCCWKPSECIGSDKNQIGLCKPVVLEEALGDCKYSSLDQFPEICDSSDYRCQMAGEMKEYISVMLLWTARPSISYCIDEGEYKAVGKNCSKVAHVPLGYSYCYCR